MTGARLDIRADLKIRVFFSRGRRLRIGDGQIVPSRRVRSDAHDGKGDFGQSRLFDGFITAVGEQDDAQIGGQIAAFGKREQTTAKIRAAKGRRPGPGPVCESWCQTPTRRA